MNATLHDLTLKIVDTKGVPLPFGIISGVQYAGLSFSQVVQSFASFRSEKENWFFGLHGGWVCPYNNYRSVFSDIVCDRSQDYILQIFPRQVVVSNMVDFHPDSQGIQADERIFQMGGEDHQLVYLDLDDYTP